MINNKKFVLKAVLCGSCSLIVHKPSKKKKTHEAIFCFTVQIVFISLVTAFSVKANILEPPPSLELLVQKLTASCMENPAPAYHCSTGWPENLNRRPAKELDCFCTTRMCEKNLSKANTQQHICVNNCSFKLLSMRMKHTHRDTITNTGRKLYHQQPNYSEEPCCCA